MPGANSRFVGLDVLRFIVATIVLAAHANSFGNAGNIFGAFHGVFGKLLALVPAAGWVAVDIFFVLSGFLVAGLLFKEVNETGTVSIGRFLIRRGFKIYPAFWVMLVVTIIWMRWHGSTISLRAYLSEFFYFQNYGVFICMHAWSLAVEEHFYFLLAGLFWILKRRRNPGQRVDLSRIPDICLAVAVVCLVARFVTWVVLLSANNQNMFWFTRSDHALLDSLFFGVMLSYFWHNRWSEPVKQRLVRWRWAFCGIGIVLILPGIMPVMDMQWFRIFGFVLVYLGAGCLLLSCLALDYIRYPAFVNWLAWLGRHSYSVYLWHIMVGSSLFFWVSPGINTRSGWALDAFIYFILCWLVGVFMARILEFPVLRIRNRLFPSNNQFSLATDSETAIVIKYSGG